mmetsp:Transcript_58165/g.136366  ORF Transcript_58165/g.136366 Transcript_58165/m.136366 type:complete len:200 (-) Transcript_58165:59-658(-)
MLMAFFHGGALAAWIMLLRFWGARSFRTEQEGLTDDMACDCKAVEYEWECEPRLKMGPAKFEPSDARWYHPAEAQFKNWPQCCKLVKSENKPTRQYKRRPTLDYCMRELREFTPDKCCVVQGFDSKTQVKVSKASRKNLAATIAQPTLADYGKKTPLSIDAKDITHAEPRILEQIRQMAMKGPVLCEEIFEPGIFRRCN